MIYYLSGAITNDPNYLEKFAKAETALKKKGHTVINPAAISQLLPPLEHKQYMSICIPMMSCADAIYMLSDWESSRGARIEKQIAEERHITVKYEVKK